MEIMITIATDTSAFEDQPVGSEIARILRGIADKVHDSGDVPNMTLFDAHGECVGYLSVDPG